MVFFPSDMIFSCTKLLRIYLWFYIHKMKILNISKLLSIQWKPYRWGRGLERRGVWHQIKTHLAAQDFPRCLGRHIQIIKTGWKSAAYCYSKHLRKISLKLHMLPTFLGKVMLLFICTVFILNEQWEKEVLCSLISVALLQAEKNTKNEATQQPVFKLCQGSKYPLSESPEASCSTFQVFNILFQYCDSFFPNPVMPK